MSLLPDDIAGMLEEYGNDHGTDMDIYMGYQGLFMVIQQNIHFLFHVSASWWMNKLQRVRFIL